MTKGKRRAFTLIELLVVMMIISVLMGIVIYTFQAVMRTKNEKSMALRLKDVKAAMETYVNMWGRPPFDTRDFSANQNRVMVDNLSNPAHSWIQQRGDLLMLSRSSHSLNGTGELLDAWGRPVVVMAINPIVDGYPADLQPPENFVVRLGGVRALVYSVGSDGVDRIRDISSDDIGPGGVDQAPPEEGSGSSSY